MENISITDKIREGALKAVAETKYVKVSDQALQELAEKINAPEGRAANDGVFFSDGGPKTLMFHLLLGVTNFCSWSDRFVVEYHGVRYGENDGCEAIAAAWRRAFEVGAPVTDAAWLAKLEEREFSAIMRTEEGETALFSRRLFNVRELGRVLAGSYGGRVENLIAAGKGDAEYLLKELSRLEAFGDYRTWRGGSYPVMCRAQWFIADVADAFHGRDYGRFMNMDRLTAPAEHRVPQFLRSSGVLVYDDELAARVDRQEVMSCESEEEYSIRAATIVAVDRLVELLHARGGKENALSLGRRLRRAAIESKPDRRYHRAYTTSY